MTSRAYNAIPQFRALNEATDALRAAEAAFVSGAAPFSAVEDARAVVAGAEHAIYAMDDSVRTALIDAIDQAAIARGNAAELAEMGIVATGE